MFFILYCTLLTYNSSYDTLFKLSFKNKRGEKTLNQINIASYHKLNSEEALERAKRLLETLKTQHASKITNFEEKWGGAQGIFTISISFSIFGIPIKGEMAGGLVVQDNFVQVYSTNISQSIVSYQNLIETTIKSELNKLLS